MAIIRYVRYPNKNVWLERKKLRERLKNFKLPNVKRPYPPLVANDLVSVQPLMGPASLIYYLKHRYAPNH